MARWAGRAGPQRPAADTGAGHVVSEASRSPRAGLDPNKRSRTLHQEHLEIAGRDVEVTEDEIGVAEMHLE